MKEVLLGMHVAICQWRERGVTRLPPLEHDDWVIQYFDVLARGFAAQPPAYKESHAMTEADAASTYEQRARAIQLGSQPLLEGFEHWLKHAGWSEPTVQGHLDNIRFFTKYLAWYTRSQHSLDEATDSDVYWFLADWFPRKALWASVASVRAYLASFKKFFTWMGATGLVAPHIVADVLDTLKFDRDEFLRKVAE